MEFTLNNVPSQKGKVSIVTGANNGIGFETAVGLAKTGCTVVMACRSLDRAKSAKEKILKHAPEADLYIILIDLARLITVRDFAKQFKDNYSQLDILINNAGVLDYSGRKNEDGVELQFAVNHLGHFLLTSLLIDLMPNQSESRIISLSSIAHKEGSINFSDLNCDNAKDKGFAYAQSKLACLMFSDELHRRLEKTGKKIISVCVHPGDSDSGLFDDMSRIQYYILKLLSPFITHSNANAAKSSLFAALSDSVKGGGYYGPQGFNEVKGPVGTAKRTEYSKDEKVASKLWRVSEEMTSTNFNI